MIASLELSENWFEAKPVVIEGMNFTSKYIGMTLVDESKGEEMAGTAIKRIVTAVRLSDLFAITIWSHIQSTLDFANSCFTTFRLNVSSICFYLLVTKIFFISSTL